MRVLKYLTSFFDYVNVSTMFSAGERSGKVAVDKEKSDFHLARPLPNGRNPQGAWGLQCKRKRQKEGGST